MLHVENKRAVTIVAGVQGTGKSTFALRYLVNAELACRFVFDPEGEYCQRLQLDAAEDLYGLSLGVCNGWVLFDPHTLFPGRTVEAFAFFCEWVWEISERLSGRKVIVVDEAWRHISQRQEPIELAQCTRSGRKRGLHCMFNTQTPHMLHAAIRNECSELVCFRLGDNRCLEWPSERGMDAETIRTLPDLEFISRNLDSGAELRGRIKV